MRRTALTIMASLLVCSTAAQADETITYSYDARGRLIQVARAGTVNNGATTTYSYDKADNRTLKSVTGASDPPPAAQTRVIVVPRNGGFAVIPIP